MRAATTAARNTIEREHAVGVRPRLYAEWEYNRYAIPTATCTPIQDNIADTMYGNGDLSAADEWLTIFSDVQSICDPNRPRTGAAKARANGPVKPLGKYRDKPDSARFYPGSATDNFKYFGSIQRTSLAKNAAGHYPFTTPIVAQVVYDRTVASNKVVVGFETSYAKPAEFTIEVSTDGKNWSTAASNPVINSDGTVTIWRGARGWDIVPDYTNPLVLKGVRVKVYSMTAGYAHADVIQVGLRLENDLTDFLISYETTFEVSDRTFISPMGKASANTASVRLSNIDGRFNNENKNSLYYGMIDKKVKLTLDVGIDATPQGGQKYEYTREFTGWSDSWGGQDQTSVTVDCKDSSVFLQEMPMPRVYFEDSTVGAIVWQIMDRIGMLNYQYTRSELDMGQHVPYYWPKDVTTTVWDELGNLCQATQTALYFDEYDVLQIRSRKAMYADKAVDWNFDAISNGQKLPDIINTDVSHDLEANRVDVTYHPATFSNFQNGLPKMETVWEPDEDTVILRSADLAKDCKKADTAIYVSPAAASYWPWVSLINIRGEIMHYTGKQYAYYKLNTVTDARTGKVTSSTALTYASVKSKDEQNKLDAASDPNQSYKNAYTGKLYLDERAMYGSGLGDHLIKGATYSSLITAFNNTSLKPWTGTNPGTRQNTGYVQLFNASTDKSTFHLRKHETSVVGGKQVMYGTKIRFPNPGKPNKDGDYPTLWGTGGIFFAGNGLDAGFYLEIATTQHVEDIENRKWANEVSLMMIPDNQPGVRLNGLNYNDTDYVDDKGHNVKFGSRGYKHAVIYNQWYSVDVEWVKNADGSVNITCYIDGVTAGNWTVPRTQVPPNEYRFGHFVRGQCNVDYEYLYGVTRDDDDLNSGDRSTFFDLKEGSFTSGFIQRQWRYYFKSIKPSYRKGKGPRYYFPQMTNRSTYAFDEFGPVVHELREFTVKFADDKIPVAHSFLNFTNTSQIECLNYEADAFGATFMLANASRDDAAVKGEDTWTMGSDNTVTHAMFVYGRALYQDNEQVLTKKDEAAIRKRGEVKTDIDSTFIQTEAMANELGSWIVSLWSGGVDEVTIDCFGNPFLQLGDLVTINHPTRSMYPKTHKYFVVSISRTFESGYTSSVVLRRARI